MDQEMGPPLDQIRIQTALKTDETLRAVFNTLIQAYDTVRQGRITDAKTIRLIARQFEAIADSPEASDLFPYDPGRAAAALYNWALDLDKRTRNRASGQVVHTAHDSDLVESVSEIPQTTTEVNSVKENTTEKIKPHDKLTHVVDNAQDLAQPDILELERQTQKRKNEGHEMAIISEQKPKVSGAAREVKVTPGVQPDLVDPSITWRALLELAKIGEEELAEEEEVKSSIDHNAIWDEWEG